MRMLHPFERSAVGSRGGELALVTPVSPKEGPVGLR
jgi:hypothetical protein